MLSIFMQKWRNEVAAVGKATEVNIGIPSTEVFPNIHVTGEGTPERPVIKEQV